VTDIGGDFLVLRGYLAGDLPAEQMRAIEARLERDPKFVRELELHLRLREGLELVQAERRQTPTFARRRELRTWASGLAAAAGCAGIALLLWTQQAPQPSLLHDGLAADSALTAAAPVAAQFTFVTVRGASTPELSSPGRGLIELRAAAGQTDAPAGYRLSLVREDQPGHSRTVGNLPAVRIGADGYLHAFVDASRLTPGDYRLEVAPAHGTGAGEAFAFRLRPPGH
jgi:hypothetical protein